MFRNPSPRALLVVFCLVLQTSGFSQQFRSDHRVIVSPPPASADFGEVMAIADFNGDRRLDFLTWTSNSSGNVIVTVMLQNSDGTFTPKEAPSLPFGTSAAADVNGDGKIDIMTVVNGPSGDHGEALGPATLVICFGNGDGAFSPQPVIDLASGPNATGVMVQDLNHDGKPDIITVSTDQYADAALQSFINTGGGNFRAGATYSDLVAATLLAAADFNGDGFPDLVVRNDPGTLILLGKGDGSFTAGATFDAVADYGAAGDLNGDHRQDLVLATPGSTWVLLGKGDGIFTRETTLDTSFGTATSDTFTNPIEPNGVYIGDLNKDGIPDIVVTTGSSTAAASVYYGKGNGAFTNPKVFNLGGGPSSFYNSATFADFNQDGRIDIIIQDAGYIIAYGAADGGFNAPVIAQAPAAGSIARGDFNGDGIDDIAVVEEANCDINCTGAFVRVFLGTGKGFFAPPRTYSIPVRWAAIAAGDVNGDGRLDLVVTRNASIINYSGLIERYVPPDLSILLGRGDGTFDAPASYTLLGKPALSAYSDSAWLVDVNHDGKLDLVGDWGTALGKGNAQFNKPIPLPSGITGIVALAPGDFNASGGVDLAVASDTPDPIFQEPSAPAFVYVLAGNGNGSFHISSKHSAAGVLDHLVTADLNGDRLSDILYTSSDIQGNSMLGVDLGKGQGAFSTAAYSYPGFATDIVTGDFNRDGNIDVALPGLFSNGADLALLLGAGGGGLGKTLQYYQGSMGKAVALRINADNAPDIAGTTTVGISRLLNTGRK